MMKKVEKVVKNDWKVVDKCLNRTKGGQNRGWKILKVAKLSQKGQKWTKRGSKRFVNVSSKNSKGRELVRKWWKSSNRGNKSWKVKTRGKRSLRSVKRAKIGQKGDKMNQKAKNVRWAGLESFKKVYKRVSSLSVNLTKASGCFKTFKMDKKELKWV